jgi:hypothetical protein
MISKPDALNGILIFILINVKHFNSVTIKLPWKYSKNILALYMC